jgi:hypothetical protein
MMNKNSDSIFKTLALVLLIVALCFGSSCKKSAPQPQPSQEKKQPSKEAVSQKADKQPAESAKQPAEQQNQAGTQTSGSQTPQTTGAAQTGNLTPADWVPVEIKLPKPMFVGTPQDARIPNLRKPLGKPRPPFLAPPGTANVALGKPVSSSDEEPIIGEIKMITDGDKEAADGSYVELGPFQQHVTIDLQGQYEIYAVVVWHYHKQPRVYKDVIVQISDNRDFVNDVKTVFNNDNDNSAGLGIGKDMHYTETAEGELIETKGVHGKYVRLYSNGNTDNDLNHYNEVDVYGIPVK